MAVGGDILEITYNHPTKGSGTLYPKAGEDSTFDLGGFRVSDDANMIDGGGKMITQMNRVRWSVEMPVAWDMVTDTTLEKIVELAGDPVEADWTISHINGSVYSGKGMPVGDLQGNGNQATLPLKISGGLKLKKII